jgi:hypothetical protein
MTIDDTEDLNLYAYVSIDPVNIVDIRDGNGGRTIYNYDAVGQVTQVMEQ